jgi:hypothetical protein
MIPFVCVGWEFVQLGKLPEKMDSKSMIAIRCETILCTDGTEALVRVCAVDQKLEVCSFINLSFKRTSQSSG